MVVTCDHAWAMTMECAQHLGEPEDAQSNDVNEEVLHYVDEHTESGRSKRSTTQGQHSKKKRKYGATFL